MIFPVAVVPHKVAPSSLFEEAFFFFEEAIAPSSLTQLISRPVVSCVRPR